MLLPLQLQMGGDGGVGTGARFGAVALPPHLLLGAQLAVGGACMVDKYLLHWRTRQTPMPPPSYVVSIWARNTKENTCNVANSTC